MVNSRTDRRQWFAIAAMFGMLLVTLVVAVALVVRPAPAPVVVNVPTEQPVAEKSSGEKVYGGWVQDDDAIAANLNPVLTQQFDQTPAGKAVFGDEDVYLWQAVRKANNRGPPWYPNVDQKGVGCCVGCGWKHCTDVALAMQIINGGRFEWKPTAVESIYGASRVEVGGGKLRGDGSVGAWAKKAVEAYGTLPMEQLDGGYDLRVFSPARARQWGSSGIPDLLEPLSKQHTVKGCALVKSWDDVKKAIQQGYPVAVCSNQGFTMQRDRDGFCSASGTWNHCMGIIGVRIGNREGGFIINSWGDNAHTGPVFPADAPVCGFWADARTIDKMVKQGDSFALADVVGFPARKLPHDFFIKAPAPKLDAMALAGVEFPLAW